MLTLREGEDVALVATGSTVHEVVEAAQQLADLGIQAKVVSVPSIRPCDTAALLAALKPCKAVITVEEHNVNSGLGSLVAEVLAEAREDSSPAPAAPPSTGGVVPFPGARSGDH